MIGGGVNLSGRVAACFYEAVTNSSTSSYFFISCRTLTRQHKVVAVLAVVVKIDLWTRGCGYTVGWGLFETNRMRT